MGTLPVRSVHKYFLRMQHALNEAAEHICLALLAGWSDLGIRVEQIKSARDLLYLKSAIELGKRAVTQSW